MKKLKSIVQTITNKATNIFLDILAYAIVGVLGALAILIPFAMVCICIKAILLCFGV